MYIPRGLEKTTVDEWEDMGEPKNDFARDYFRCSYTYGGSGDLSPYPKDWPMYGEPCRCRKVRGHSGEHKWYDSVGKSDYDMWLGSSKYDYQCEEL